MNDRKDLPNLVIFLPDSMRGDAVSLGGVVNSHIKTPHMDQIAKEGVAFTNCFTVNTVCVPSRCCTFTGQYVHSNGHRSLYQLLQPHEENLFKFLRDNGYNVVWVGRNDLFSKESGKISVSKRIKANRRSHYKSNPFPEGHYLKKSFYYGERTQEEAKDIDHYLIQDTLKYLESRPETPFCLYISLNFPHPPYTVEEPYFSMYDRNKIPTPLQSNLNDKPEFMTVMRERYGLTNLKEEDFKDIIATYYSMITRVDHQLGEILNKLKEIGEYENSALLLSSDHGDFTGNFGLTEKWPNAFQDCLVNIPLVMKIPGIAPKEKFYNQLVESIDIFPTVLDIAKIETPYTHFGKSLTPLIKGEKNEIREAVFAEGGYNTREPQCFETVIKNPNNPNIGIYYEKTNIPRKQPLTVARSVMIRTHLWKLILRSVGKEELYDLKTDPSELHNLIDNPINEEIKSDLKERLLRWYLQTSDNSNWRRNRSV
ncbi:MAG: sulfatase-like hydrolase/transferase [Promethearchaeota archaeon]|jgi:choline-sulfatase